MHPAVALLTDFGMDNHYVAQMKGRILGISPHSALVDICHSVEPQNISQAAIILRDTEAAFPKGTVFVVVVDPGVGTSRPIVAMNWKSKFFVCPDNGLLTLLLEQDAPIEIVEVDCETYNQGCSATFHGRDIMAPVAAQIAAGNALGSLGTQRDDLIRLQFPSVQQGSKGAAGQVVLVDRFGNVITNINRTMIPTEVDSTCRITVGDREINGIVETYADLESAKLLALFGSNNHLEVAINGGNAADQLSIATGAPIKIEWER